MRRREANVERKPHETNAFRAFFEVSTNEYKKATTEKKPKFPLGVRLKNSQRQPKIIVRRNVEILGFGNGATALFLSAPGPTF